MPDLAANRERYLRDTVPIRLGGLAANLSRISSFSDNPGNREPVEHLIVESKHFIERTAADTETDTAVALSELQAQLANWQLEFPSNWTDSIQRKSLADQARIWSDRVLGLSGLLD